MRVLGAAPASDHVALVVLEVSAEGWTVVDTSATRKIGIGDHEDPRNLHDFKDAVSAFINSYGVEKLIIRRCTYRGQKRSGAASIKMETLLQLLPCASELVPPQSISRRLEQHGAQFPSELTRYQEHAFAAALWALDPDADAV